MAAALWGATGALAQTAAKPADAPPPAPAKTSGLTVFVDPVTRQIRQPTASEIGALVSPAASSVKAAAPSAPSTAPRIIRGPGGAVGIQLDDSAMSFMVATRKADGKLAVECVTGVDEAASRVAAPSQDAKAPTPDIK